MAVPPNTVAGQITERRFSTTGAAEVAISVREGTDISAAQGSSHGDRPPSDHGSRGAPVHRTCAAELGSGRVSRHARRPDSPFRLGRSQSGKCPRKLSLRLAVWRRRRYLKPDLQLDTDRDAGHDLSARLRRGAEDLGVREPALSVTAERLIPCRGRRRRQIATSATSTRRARSELAFSSARGTCCTVPGRRAPPTLC